MLLCMDSHMYTKQLILNPFRGACYVQQVVQKKKESSFFFSLPTHLPLHLSTFPLEDENNKKKRLCRTKQRGKVKRRIRWFFTLLF